MLGVVGAGKKTFVPPDPWASYVRLASRRSGQGAVGVGDG
jgi:hypothetical protein